jgi:hypothetical protein
MNHWDIYDPNGHKVEDRPTREGARKRVYELNGWKYVNPLTKANMDQFVNEVRLMRKWQREYFRTRSSEALRYAKGQEKRVDEALERIEQEKEKKNNPKLF